MRPDAVAVLVPPAGLWQAWSLDPVVVAALAGAALAYGRGLRVLGAKRNRPIAPRQATAFLGGLGLLAVALLSPLDALDSTLLSAHMAQHLLLLLVAPPLLVYGRPGLVVPMGLPRRAREGLGRARHTRGLRRLVRWSRNPLAVLGITSATLWAWHLPALYDAAIRNPALHAAEHLCFLGTSLAFWHLIIDAGPRRRLGYAPGMLLAFAVMLQSAALGALLTLSPVVWYPVYRAGAGLWGVSPLGDQQLAGALMWVPPGALYLITIIVLAARWFAEVERRMRHTQAAPAAAPGPAGLPAPAATPRPAP